MIYVMSDLHGMYEKYLKMLDMIKFSQNDQLYILGDIIDRGSQSIKLLIDIAKRDNVYPIFGNHELMAIRCLNFILSDMTKESVIALTESERLDLFEWINNGGDQMIGELKKLSVPKRKAIISYLMDFSAYEEIEINGKYYFLVHAGLNNYQQNKQLYEYDVDDFVWARLDFKTNYFNDLNKFVIVGHTPTLLFSNEAKIFYKNNFINIDCGAYLKNGRLACLCLDTMAEFYVD